MSEFLGERLRELGALEDAEEDSGGINGEDVDIGSTRAAHQRPARCAEELLAQVMDARLDKSVLAVRLQTRLEPTVELDEIFALRHCGEVDGEGEDFHLEDLLERAEGLREVQQPQDGLRLRRVQLRHGAHQRFGLERPEPLEERSTAGGVARDEEGEELFEEIALELRLLPRPRRGNVQQRRQQRLRRRLERLCEELLDLGIIAARV